MDPRIMDLRVIPESLIPESLFPESLFPDMALLSFLVMLRGLSVRRFFGLSPLPDGCHGEEAC